MPNRVQALNWFDATGGLNTRKSAFQLAANEVPEILNMEIDARGGVYTRKGWGQWSTDQVITPGVEPYLKYVSGSKVQIADSAAFDLTGDHQIVVGFRTSDWSPSSPKMLACHSSALDGFGGPAANGWTLYLMTDGKLLYRNRWSGGQRSFTSSAATTLASNTNGWFGISFDQSNGSSLSEVRFWQSAIGPNGAWTEIGTARTNAANNAAIAGVGPMFVGSEASGASMWSGRGLHFELRTAIGASNTMSTVSVAFEMDTSTDLAAAQVSDLTFTAASGPTVTITPGMLVNSSAWNPRNAYLHENSSGTQYVLVANGTTLWSASAGGTFTSITNSDLAASPHLASFAPWGDNVYVAMGRSRQVMRTTGTGVGTLLTASGAGQWQNDPTVHAGTHMPKAEHVASHSGYMFAANLTYDATNYPNRLHFSHPGFPESWLQTDWLDIAEGGSKITGLAAATDHLLIFKTDSIWALFGSDASTWSLSKITGDMGVRTPTAICKGMAEIFFFGGEGIYSYTRQGISEVSYPIRNIFPDVPVLAYDNVWLGWVDRRLWVSIPYDPYATDPPTEPVSTFVFDPKVGAAGAWTLFRGADGHPPAPFVDHTSSADAPQLAFCRTMPHAILMNARNDAYDSPNGTVMGFESYVRTPWFDAGMPSLRKSWRRPDYIFRNIVAATSVGVNLYTDFDAESISRSQTIELEDEPGGLWGDGRLWGDGSLWGFDGPSARIKRGSTLGLARAVALRLTVPAGTQWGLNALVAKFVPRRLR